MMQPTIDNGWLETSPGTFWAYYKDGKWTGLTIAEIPPWPSEKPENPRTVYHVRSYHPPSKPEEDCDVGRKSSLKQAKLLAESYLDRTHSNVV